MTYFPIYTRHRESDSENITDSLFSYHQINYAGTVDDPWKISSESDNSGSVFSRRLQTMDDCVTPMWQRSKSKGVITNNPMDSTTTIWQQGLSSYLVNRINRNGTSPNYYYSGYRQAGTNKVGDLLTSLYAYPPEPDADPSVIARAITECYANISFSETQALVQLGEFHKTMGSLISIIRRVLKIMRNLKNLRLKAVLGEFSAKELSQRYMEARYALRPLMYDIKGTIKAFNGETNRSLRQTFRGFESKVASEQYSDVTLYSAGSPAYYYLTGSQLATRTIEARAGVLTSVDSQMLMKLNIWGLDEPFQAAWELVPFSFIMDWFLNIGKVLASWSPKPSFRILASWQTVTDAVSLSSTVESGVSTSPSYNYENTIVKNGTYSRVTVRKYRFPNPERPILPSFNLRLNEWKILDLGIILKQLFKISSKF